MSLNLVPLDSARLEVPQSSGLEVIAGHKVNVSHEDMACLGSFEGNVSVVIVRVENLE